jgi:hypothetical protein
MNSQIKALTNKTNEHQVSVLRLVISLLALFGFAVSSAHAATYYVSTTGNDANAGTLALPFRTIQKAAGLMRAGDTCLIRAGTYRETVTPVNSGASGAPITFDAYPNERVIISGANVVSGFTLHSGNIYKAAMTSIGSGNDQIFMGGAVQPEARFPDTASSGLAYPVPLSSSVWPPRGYFSVPNTTQVTGALLNGQPAGMWTGGLYTGTHYASYQFQRADITNSASGSLTVAPLPGKWYIPPFWDAENGRGFISGVMNAITVPGEWVWKSGMLYIQLPAGQTPNATTVEAKARQLAFNLTGKSYITIRKLEVIAAGLTMYDGSYNVIDGAKFSYVHQKIRPVAGEPPNDTYHDDAGIYLGGRNNTIRNSIIAFSAGGGVKLLGLNQTVTNCIIHDCGYGGYGSLIGMEVDPLRESGTSARGGHTISYNTLYNAGGVGVSMSRHILYFLETGRSHVPYYKTGLPTPYLKNLLTHNEIYNVGIYVRDIGAHFYTHGTDGGGTEISYNVIHDNLMPGHGGVGVYLDEGSYNFDTHHNLLWMGREEGTRGAFGANIPSLEIQTVRGVNNTDPRIRTAGAQFILTTPGEPGVGIWHPRMQSPYTQSQLFAPYSGAKPRIFVNNKYKYDYHGGVAGLTDADFPGGRFAFGATLSNPVVTQPPLPAPTPTAPSIATQPASRSVIVGQAATFSVVASGTAPLTMQWQKNGVNISGATGTSYTTPATTTADNGATFRVIVTNSVGSVTSANATLTLTAVSATQTPFSGTSMAIPGTIVVSRYDNGGEGIAYHDTESANLWTSTYRPGQGVDSDGTGIGWTAAGEWLEYTVNVASSGMYTITMPVSNPGSGGTLHIRFNGTNVTGSVTIPNTGNWTTYTSLTKSVNLIAGAQVMRVSFDGASSTGWVCNLRDIAVTSAAGTGLVALWKLDETSGTTAADSSGNALKGTLGNYPASGWTTGKIAGALNFNGISNVVSVGSPAALINLTRYTIAAWIKPRSFGEAKLGRILNKRNSGISAGWSLFLTGDGSAFLRQTFSVTEGAWCTPVNSVALGTWQHVAVAYDNSLATNRPAFYVNGKLVTTTVRTAPSGSKSSDAASTLSIGNTAGMDRTFDGALDDVRIYNRILTASEVSGLVTAMPTGTG